MQWHTLSLSDSFEALSSSAEGLTSKEAKQRLEKFGRNALPAAAPDPLWKTIIEQLNNLLNYVLIIAALFSLLTGHFIDFWVIFFILIINTGIGIFHQVKARKIVASLSEGYVGAAVALRDGRPHRLPESELVPGDIIYLKEGSKIPADIRFIEATGVHTVESSLTGESKSVEKHTGQIESSAPLAEQANLGFKSTMMVTGEAKGLVIATGLHTQVGQIASSLSTMKESKSLFEERTELLVKQMVGLTFVISGLIFAIGLVRDIPLMELILFVLATLISGIPEGLPTILVIVLSIAALRMSRRQALLKRIASIESLSSVTTIITDKTGTLTQNIMQVMALILPDGRKITVTGSGWEPIGDFLVDGTAINPLDDPALEQLLMLGGFNDQADIVKSADDPHRYEHIGDPTEASRVVLTRKAGISADARAERYELIHNVPYDQKKKYRAMLLEDKKADEHLAVIVGGADTVLEACRDTISQQSKKTDRGSSARLSYESWQKTIANYAGQGFRMQALAYQVLPAEASVSQLESFSHAESGYHFLGVLVIQDPIRADVPAAVKKAQTAGLRIIMATGDHPATARAIGLGTGISEGSSEVLTTQEIEQLDDMTLFEKLKTVRVCARVTPTQKLRIATLLQANGEVIAMTGDGTNDAPALKRADVGIAMGRIGTDAAREASDLILLDDNFATIVAAIEEGRTVFRNVRQTSLYLLTTNFAEGLVMLFSMAAGWALPLLPLQILWLNLVSDGVSGIALATEKPQATTLTARPRSRSEGILSRKNFIFILTLAAAMVIGTLLLFAWWMNRDLSYARTVAFVFLVFTQLFNMLNLRSLDMPITQLGFFSNPAITVSFGVSTALLLGILYLPVTRTIFGFAPISIPMVGFLLIISSLIFVMGEILKRFHTID